MTTYKLTSEQIQKMKHSIGLTNSQPKNGEYKAYRNYYHSARFDEELEELCNMELAEKRELSNAVYYHITDKGIVWLEDILNLKITLC